jgi:hypothetical protein
MADDDDWGREPPEGRISRERSRPEFWANQWQAAVAMAVLGILAIVVVVAILVFA